MRYRSGGIVYSKPRFIIEDGARDAVSPLWRASRLAGLVYAAVGRNHASSTSAQTYGPESERGQLGRKIVDAFAADVAENGAAFLVTHLPRRDHLSSFHSGEALPWQFLIDHFESSYRFINAEDFLSADYTNAKYFQPNWHYGPLINAKIAEAVGAELLTCVIDRTCLSERLADSDFAA